MELGIWELRNSQFLAFQMKFFLPFELFFALLKLMIYSLSGKLIFKKDKLIVVDVGGVGYKIIVSIKTFQDLPLLGESVKIFCHLHVRENALDLFGFLNEQDLELFERLITVSGVGPKSALAVMAITATNQLMAAINEGEIDLLTKASGVGRKTAERIILELKGRLLVLQSSETVKIMESDLDLEEVLISLGYTRQQAKKSITHLDVQTKGLESRLKASLKFLKK